MPYNKRCDFFLYIILTFMISVFLVSANTILSFFGLIYICINYNYGILSNFILINYYI